MCFDETSQLSVCDKSRIRISHGRIKGSSIYNDVIALHFLRVLIISLINRAFHLIWWHLSGEIRCYGNICVIFSHGIIHCSVYIVGDRCYKCVDIISMVVCE